MKNDFINKLKNFQNLDDTLYEESEATSEGIIATLKDIFIDGEDVDIITPEMSSIYTIDKLEGSISYMKMIEEGYLREEGKESYRKNLERPVVAVVNTSAIKQNAGRVDYGAISKNGHWQVLVIIPAEENNVDVFFHDPLFPRKLPTFFKNLFNNSYDYEIKSDTGTHKLSTGGKFQAVFHEEQYKIQQQTGGYDCGWWSLYNTIMFVHDKNDEFLNTYKDFDKNTAKDNGAKLRKLFSQNNYDLTQSSVQPISSMTSTHNKEEIAFIEEQQKEIEGFLVKDRKDSLGVMSAVDNEISDDLAKKVLGIDSPTFQLLLSVFQSTNSLEKAFELIEWKENNNIEVNEYDPIMEGSAAVKRYSIDSRQSQLEESQHKEFQNSLILEDGKHFTDSKQNFHEFMVGSAVYVDKTMLVKDIIDHGGHLLLTCPRRWGKSLNLSMIKAFLEPEINKRSCKINEEDRDNDALFDGHNRDAPLSIYKYGNLSNNVIRELLFAPYKLEKARERKADYYEALDDFVGVKDDGWVGIRYGSNGDGTWTTLDEHNQSHFTDKKSLKDIIKQKKNDSDEVGSNLKDAIKALYKTRSELLANNFGNINVCDLFERDSQNEEVAGALLELGIISKQEGHLIWDDKFIPNFKSKIDEFDASIDAKKSSIVKQNNKKELSEKEKQQNEETNEKIEKLKTQKNDLSKAFNKIIDYRFNSLEEYQKKQLSEHFGFCNKYMGKYPVIYLDLKGLVPEIQEIVDQSKNEKNKLSDNKSRGKADKVEVKNDLINELKAPNSIEQFKANLRTALSKAYKEHEYIWDWLENKTKSESGRIAEIARVNLLKLKAYYNGENIPKAPLSEGITFLAEQLHEFFGRKAFVLIDEYDRAANKVLEDNFFAEQKKEEAKILMKLIINEISSLLEPIAKSEQDHVQQIILTGITNCLLKEGHSALNNISEYGVLDITYSGSDFAKYFGFSGVEVKEQIFDKIFQKHFLKGKSDPKSDYELLFSQLQYWYNGQVIGKEEIFTPSSVIKYFGDLLSHQFGDARSGPMKFKNYWSDTGFSNVLKNISHIGISNELLNKLKDIAINDKSNKEGVDLSQFIEAGNNIYDLINEKNPSTDKLAIYLLIKSGYLSRTAGSSTLFKLPAREVNKSFISNILKYWINNLTGKDADQLIKGFIGVLEKNDNEIANYLNNNLLSSIKTAGNNEMEADFQVLLNGISILAEVSDRTDLTHIARSEWNSVNNKRIDGFFIPLSHHSKVYIHEYKQIEGSIADGKTKLNEAIVQIFKNRYVNSALKINKDNIYAEKQNNNWENLVTRGISFYYDEASKNDRLTNQSKKKWKAIVKSIELSKADVQEIDKKLATIHKNTLLKYLQNKNESFNSKNNEVDLIIEDYLKKFSINDSKEKNSFIKQARLEFQKQLDKKFNPEKWKSVTDAQEVKEQLGNLTDESNIDKALEEAPRSKSKEIFNTWVDNTSKKNIKDNAESIKGSFANLANLTVKNIKSIFERYYVKNSSVPEAAAKEVYKKLFPNGGFIDTTEAINQLLSDQEIKESLLSLREEFLGRRSDASLEFYIPQSRVRDQEEVILTDDNIATELGYWARSTDKGTFLGIAKLLNKEGGAHHAVLVHGTRVFDEETKEDKIEIVIKDPLKNRSKIMPLYKESSKKLIDSIASLEKSHRINVDVKGIKFLGIQKDEESNCAEISIAQLRSQLEDYGAISSLLKNKVSNFESGIASIVENIKDLTNVRELIQEFHEQDKLKSLLSVVRLTNSYGDTCNVLLYSNKYIEDDKEFDKVSILDPFGKVGDDFYQARIGLSNIINSEIGKHDNNILFLQLTHKIENNELMGRLLSSFIRFHNSQELSKNLSSELDISDLGKKRKYNKVESDNLDDWLLYIQNNKRELTEKLSKKNDIDQYSRTTQNKKLEKNLHDNQDHEHDSDNMCGEIAENKLGGSSVVEANSLLKYIFKQEQFVKEVMSIKYLKDISKQHKNLYLINPQGSESKFNSELVDFIQRNPSTTVVLADTQKDQSSCFDHSVILSTMISGKLAALGFDDSLYKIGIFYTENEYGKHANIFLSTDLDQGFAEEKLILPAIRYYASTTGIDSNSPHIIKSVKDFELLQIVENVQNMVDGDKLNDSQIQDKSSLTTSLYNIEQKMRNIGYDFHKKSGFIKKGSKEDIALQELEYKHDIISELQTELKEKFIQTQILEEYEEPKNLKHASSLETTSYNENIRVNLVLQTQRTSAFPYIIQNKPSLDSSSDLVSDSNTLVLSRSEFDSPVQRSNSSVGWFRSVMLRYVFSDELKQVGEVIGRTRSRIDSTSNRKLKNTLLKDPIHWDKKDQRSINLVLHPDKGGNSEDFQLVNGMIEDLKGSSTFSLMKAAYSKVSEKVEKSLGITESTKQTIAKVGDFASKATTVLKAGELVIDSVRMISTPTLENAEKVVLDSAHLYSSIKGMNYFSVGVTAYSATRAGIATASLYWESGEYGSAALYGTIAAGDVVVKSAMYIAVPMVLAYANPVLGTGYTIYIAGYTGYHVYSSASLLYNDLTHEGQNIKENIQYLSRWSNIDYALSWTPLQLFHDFADSSKFYENEMQKKIKVEKITETLNNLNNKSLAIKQDLYEQNKVGVWNAYSHSLGKDYTLASLGLDYYKIENGSQDSVVYLGEKIVCGKITELSDLKEYKCYGTTDGHELGNITLNSDLYIVDHHLSEAL